MCFSAPPSPSFLSIAKHFPITLGSNTNSSSASVYSVHSTILLHRLFLHHLALAFQRPILFHSIPCYAIVYSQNQSSFAFHDTFSLPISLSLSYGVRDEGTSVRLASYCTFSWPRWMDGGYYMTVLHVFLDISSIIMIIGQCWNKIHAGHLQKVH